jgi:hypothetical protein
MTERKEVRKAQGTKPFYEREGVGEAAEIIISALECPSGGFAKIDEGLKTILVGTTTDGQVTVAMSKVLLDISTPLSAYQDEAERTPYMNRNRPIRPNLGCTVQFGYQLKPNSAVHSSLFGYFKGASGSKVWCDPQNTTDRDALSAVKKLEFKINESLDFYYTQEQEPAGFVA